MRSEIKKEASRPDDIRGVQQTAALYPEIDLACNQRFTTKRLGTEKFANKIRSQPSARNYRLCTFIARATSRLPSRSAITLRLSCSPLPLASAISHFTRPFFQCKFTGTKV